MQKQAFIYNKLNELELCMTFYSQPTSISTKGTILYLHGGGLLYGDRDDLPEKYLKLFLENGYSVLSIDYPLAPEVKLATIYACLEKALDWYLSHYQKTLHMKTADYFLFGRSAGGYLAYLLSARYPSKNQKGLISFYSYYDLTLPELNQPSSYYKQFPLVAPLTAQAMISSAPIKKASVNERFALYLSGRQFGNWLSYCLHSVNEKSQFSLSMNELQLLPPTFLTHSSADQDVPVNSSREAAKIIPSSTYQEVKNLPHDFDRDLAKPEGFSLYLAVIDWLDSL